MNLWLEALLHISITENNRGCPRNEALYFRASCPSCVYSYD